MNNKRMPTIKLFFRLNDQIIERYLNHRSARIINNCSRCINHLFHSIIMINMNELYMEAKGKWKSLYPIYFDSKKTIAQGRRLSKELCIDSPTIEELAKAVGMCQLRNILEPHKSYSRDYFCLGRLKVELVNDKGEPIKKQISKKQQLLLKTAQNLRLLRQK